MTEQNKRPSLKKEYATVITILLIHLLVLLIVFSIPLHSFFTLRHRQFQGVWVAKDNQSYINFDHPEGFFGEIYANDEIYLVYYWFEPKSPVAFVSVVDEFCYDAIHSNSPSADWHIVFKKDYFIATVTESDFMEVGTVLTFYRTEQ